MDRGRAVLLVAVAGAAGAICRWGLSAIITQRAGERFPWGTLAVNVLGCFLLGLTLTLARDRFPGLEPWRPVFAAGFLGAFTTFATFAWEADALASGGRWWSGVLYVVTSVLLGLGALRLGVVLARG